MDLTFRSYCRNAQNGHMLFARGVVPLHQGIMLSHISRFAKGTALRERARRVVVGWRLGELVGERRGTVG